jgi:hypothetical protein
MFVITASLSVTKEIGIGNLVIHVEDQINGAVSPQMQLNGSVKEIAV